MITKLPSSTSDQTCCWIGESVPGRDCRAMRALTASSISEFWVAAYIAARFAPLPPQKRKIAATSQQLQLRRRPDSARVYDVAPRVARELLLEWGHPTPLRVRCD